MYSDRVTSWDSESVWSASIGARRSEMPLSEAGEGGWTKLRYSSTRYTCTAAHQAREAHLVFHHAVLADHTRHGTLCLFCARHLARAAGRAAPRRSQGAGTTSAIPPSHSQPHSRSHSRAARGQTPLPHLPPGPVHLTSPMRSRHGTFIHHLTS